MDYILIENGTCKIVKETEKAYLLENADSSSGTRAWFPKAALVRNNQYVTFPNGKTGERMEIATWFYNKAKAEHDVVIGRGI